MMNQYSEKQQKMIVIDSYISTNQFNQKEDEGKTFKNTVFFNNFFFILH